MITTDLIKKYGEQLNSIPKIKLEDAEELYFYFYKLSDRLQNELWKNFCNGNKEFERYFGDLAHETNSQAGNALNNLRNYYWYVKNGTKDERAIQEIRHKFFHAFNMFTLGLRSIEIFYTYVYKKGNQDEI